MVLFMDESNKDRKAARKKYGRSPVGKQVNSVRPFNSDICYTFFGAANYLGFVPAACDAVLHQYKEKEDQKHLTADTFVEYFKTKVVPILGTYSREEPNSVVVMDNCSIHMDSCISKMVKAAGSVIV